jgi:hypothetical protein
MRRYKYISPRGPSSPLGAKFTPRCKLHHWGQTHDVKKMPSESCGCSVKQNNLTKVPVLVEWLNLEGIGDKKIFKKITLQKL